MAAILWGLMDFRPSEPEVVGFWPPSETQLAVGLEVTTGISWPLMPSGT